MQGGFRGVLGWFLGWFSSKRTLFDPNTVFSAAPRDLFVASSRAEFKATYTVFSAAAVSSFVSGCKATYYAAWRSVFKSSETGE